MIKNAFRGICALIALFTISAQGGQAMALTLSSPAFSNESAIPKKYTCDGNNVSPPLTWSGAPSSTKSFALISDDPDAPMGTWVHWVAWNIPASVSSLPENVAPKPEMPDGTRQGISSFGKPGYGGPCPPSGTHRYYFKIYALDTTLSLPPTTDKAALESAMKGHIVEQAQCMGTYSR